MSRTPNAEKGARYLGLLDTALCNGSWGEIPELARKVEKHAPDRKCLTLAARAEAQVASASHRPTSASSATATSIHRLSDLVPTLNESLSSAESSHPDDAIIARTCLAQIYWLQEEPLNALQVLARPITPSKSPAGASALGWLEVCEVKSSYIQATCLNASGSHTEARETYQAATLRTPGYRTPELRRWTERLLGRACLYSVKTVPSPSVRDLSEMYSTFKAWGAFWQRSSSSSTGTASTGQWDIPRRQVWKAYYDLLSTVLQHELLPTSAGLVPTTSIIADQQPILIRQQRAEISRVETIYESLLLGETKFPKASQSNAEVEKYVDQVITNWRIVTSKWTDSDLGEGGRDAVSRNALEILYRASTKTFHSTAILRQLFTVHSALGEFDLAMHAFDSYVDIVDKGKARVEKTGKHEIGFDDDDTAMLTAAEAVRTLCRYGDRGQAEKANEVVSIMSKWLTQLQSSTAEPTQPNGHDEGKVIQPSEQTASLRQTTMASAYRAMGISQAHWAHLTYDSSIRSILLADANNNLRRAQRFEPDSIDTAYSLAVLLVQMRDMSGALEVTRNALTGSVILNGEAVPQQHHNRERQLLSLWHLLALALTAQDQYDTAAQICEAAYKQFANSRVLLGTPSQLDPCDPEKSTNAPVPSRGLADQMEGFEKESLLQIRMSQILLVELMEGPDAAVDLTDSLLGLYSKLFGSPEQVALNPAKPLQTAASATPSRLGGTLRSITGSIRPRSNRSRRSSTERGTLRPQSVTSADGSVAVDQRPATNGTGLGPPIAITVTNEDGSPAGKPHHRHHLHLPFHGKHHGHESPPIRSTGGSIAEKDENRPPTATECAPVRPTQGTPDQPLNKVIHNASPSHWPPPAGHEDQPPIQDVRIPVPHPASSPAAHESRLLPIHERRQRIGVLITTWLFVAELYLRAESLDDAQNAVDQASKLVTTLENQFGSEEGVNARRLFEKGWGGAKSIDESWADIWATKAHLALARKLPFDAMLALEQCLSYYPDHAEGIIGLSHLLLDIFEEKMPAEEPLAPAHPPPTMSGSLINEAKPSLTRPNTASTEPSRRPSLVTDHKPEVIRPNSKLEATPAELNRLAARDRAYGLLSNLTKLGSGWDNSEAWYALARAHELSREVDKAKKALWWVVELEDNRPLRPWRKVAPGGYTL